MKYIKAIIVVILLVVIDQITKHMAVTALKGNDGISVIDGVFRLYYVENRGSAFSLLQNQRTYFIIFTVIVLAVIVYIYRKIPDTARMLPIKILAVGISAGAVGNLIDRIRLSYVVDFLYFELINFPVFNVADIYVTCSTILLIVLGIFYYKDEDLEFLSRRKKK